MALPIDVIRENARNIRKSIQEEARGRKILFCAACKTQSLQTVEAANNFDFDVFGENRAQELVRNFEAGAYGQKPVHFIGHIQSRKVRDIVGKASLIESVDSIKLMELIEKEAQKRDIVQHVLVEINIGGEENKSGIPPASLIDFLTRCEAMGHILVRGIMSVPPKTQDFVKKEDFFKRLYKLFIDMQAKKYDNVSVDYLSMGMSDDFRLAVRCGANIVRVGTALFGERDYGLGANNPDG